MKKNNLVIGAILGMIIGAITGIAIGKITLGVGVGIAIGAGLGLLKCPYQAQSLPFQQKTPLRLQNQLTATN